MEPGNPTAPRAARLLQISMVASVPPSAVDSVDPAPTGPHARLPSRLMERVDVVVVGAGVMGSAAVLALARRGVETVLFEQFDAGHSRGSSHGPTRIFRLAYPHQDYTRLAVGALEAWRRLEEESGERLLVTTGGLDVGPVAVDCHRSLEEAGIDHEWVSATEAGARWPAIEFSGLDQILYQSDAGVCLADRTVAAQVAAARKRGADIRENTPVRALRPDHDGVIVEAGEEEIRTRVAVVTAGAWARALLAGAGLPDLPLTPVLQHVTYFAARNGSPEPIPTFIDWSGPGLSWYALSPVGEAPGVKLGQHVGGRPVDPADGPFLVDPARPAAHAAYVRKRFPGLDPAPVHAETCLYTMTPDEDFIVDRVGQVVVGSPCSGHGFKFAPFLGEVLADLALGADPRLPDRFRLDRPALRNHQGAVTIEGP
jgi:sarcosine oxidase